MKSLGDPGRVAVYAWWTKHIDQPERHHIWPKWLLGDEAQVGMMLPRCIHNMAGVGLDDGGFHQVLNALFAQDEKFRTLRVEDSEGFRRYFKAIKSKAERADALEDIREILNEAYRLVLADPGLQQALRGRLVEEMDRIPLEAGK